MKRAGIPKVLKKAVAEVSNKNNCAKAWDKGHWANRK
jgi:hypothetical protein